MKNTAITILFVLVIAIIIVSYFAAGDIYKKIDNLDTAQQDLYSKFDGLETKAIDVRLDTTGQDTGDFGHCGG